MSAEKPPGSAPDGSSDSCTGHSTSTIFDTRYVATLPLWETVDRATSNSQTSMLSSMPDVH